MDFFISAFNQVHEALGNGLWVLLIFMATIGIVAQWKLYVKAGLPGIHCIIPVQNVITFLKIVGRPASHAWYFIVPVYNLYFTFQVYKELCQAFNKQSILDYILVIVFNGLYVLNLGLAYDSIYYGPVYQLSKDDINKLIKTRKKEWSSTSHRKKSSHAKHRVLNRSTPMLQNA